jgi:hypothetical protein
MSERSTTAGQDRHARLEKAKEVAVEQFRGYVAAFLYIWVLLGMFTLHEEIALRTHGGASAPIPFLPHGFALVNALVLGKVALVVEDLRLGTRVKAQPLIYPILIEAFILAVLFMAMHVLEGVIGALLHGRSLAASVPSFSGGGLTGVLFSAISFFVAMIPFCAFRQIGAAIGWERMRALLFGAK